MRLPAYVSIPLAAFALGAALVRSNAGAADIGPALQVRALAPFSVRGTQFKASELVTVTLQGIWVKRVRANVGGAFAVTYRYRSVDRCDGYVVKAVGSKGSTAQVRAHPLMCASTNPG